MVHAALKWFQSFIPIYDPNPLDGACAKSIIQSAKRTKGNPIVKKELTTTEIIKNILDIFAAEGASLKDLRIAALCTLGFAGFFRFREDLEDHITMFVPLSKKDGEQKEILCALQKPFPYIAQFFFCLDICAKRL